MLLRKVLRKLAEPIRFDLYALAQMREAEVRSRCKEPCAECPGPLARDGCLTRKFPAVVGGRADWPFCPWGMLRTPAWADFVETYFVSKVAATALEPRRQSAWVRRAAAELLAAIRKNDEARQREASKPALPNFLGRRDGRGAP